MTAAPLLSAATIRKAYGGVRALRDVSFALDRAEVHAVVGENGAGKSTLIKVLTGAVRPDAGALSLDGSPIDLAQFTPARARALGIATVHQHPSLFPHLSVAENVAMATAPSRWWQPVDWAGRRRHAAELLDRVGATFGPDCVAGSLSMPEQQLVEIARALGANARVILMDEPTASLTGREVDRLFGVVRRIRREGAGVLYISHRLDEVFALADRITVLRDGESVASGLPGELTQVDVVRWMAGRDVHAERPARAAPPGEVALEVHHLSSRAAGVFDVSFEVRRGEVLGIAGLVGSGRTELAETLFGLHRIDSGDVLVNGTSVHLTDPAAAIARGLAYVPEDRRRHGAIVEMSVAENISMACLHAVSVRGLLHERAERLLAERFVEQFAIKTPGVGTPVAALSGGNQQKVVVGRWLATQPTVLLLDEPTQGVDVAAKADIHAVMRALLARGLAIVMISSDLPEVLAMSDRIAVMREGTIVTTLAGGATAEEVLAAALLDEAPLAPQV